MIVCLNAYLNIYLFVRRYVLTLKVPYSLLKYDRYIFLADSNWSLFSSISLLRTLKKKNIIEIEKKEKWNSFIILYEVFIIVALEMEKKINPFLRC